MRIFNCSVLLLLILVSVSCYDDAQEILSNDLHGLILDTERIEYVLQNAYNEKFDSISFVAGTDFAIKRTQLNSRINSQSVDNITISTFEVSENNLNNLLQSEHDSIEVLSLTFLEEISGSVDGLIIHYVDYQGILRLSALKKSANTNMFESVKLPVNQVGSFTLGNLFFIARNIFPSRNLVTIGVNRFKYLDEALDEVSMYKFAVKYNIIKNDLDENTISSSRILSETLIAPPQPQPPTQGCALAVHHCRHAYPGQTNCQPFNGGCREPGTCLFNSMLSDLESSQKISEYNILSSNLEESSLYQLRDWLNEQHSGSFYIDAYYELSDDFLETIDTEMLSDIISVSYDLRSLISAINNGERDYVLTEDVFNKIRNVALKSVQKSNNLTYNDIVYSMINRSEVYVNKNIDQIIFLMNQRTVQ